VSAAGAPAAADAGAGSPGASDNGEMQAGLDWVRIVPKAADADFREALLGFSGKRLRRMILKDKLGETAVVVFQRAERNAQVSESEVSFTPPSGADVIGTPEK
jgi:outer membrane lipoprotein carrier protein